MKCTGLRVEPELRCRRLLGAIGTVSLLATALVVGSRGAAASTEPVPCPDKPPVALTYGQTVECVIAAEGEEQQYRFEASRFDRIVIRMSTATTGNRIRPRVVLHDPTGARVADISAERSCTFWSGCSTAVSLDHTELLMRTGTYTLVATTAFGGDPTGGYFLQVQRATSPPVWATPIPPDTTLSGFVHTPADLSTYTIFVEDEQKRARVRAMADGGQPDVGRLWIRVFNPRGDLRCSDSRGEVSSCDLVDPGYHTVIVSTGTWSGARGGYTVTFSCLSSPCPEPDTSPPSIDGIHIPPANEHGWNNTSVDVRWEVGPKGKIAFTHGCEPSSLSHETEGTTETCVATTWAGVTATADVTVRIDATPPRIGVWHQAPPPNPEGWNNTDVTVTWWCDDTLSGVEDRFVDRTITSEGGNLNATGTCRDLAGNSASHTQGGIYIDKTPPNVSMQTMNGSLFVGSAALEAHASDELSEVRSLCFEVREVAGEELGCHTATQDSGDTWAADVALGTGFYEVAARATDRADNESLSNPITIVVAGG